MRTHSIFPGTTSFLVLLAIAEGPSTGAEIQTQIVADTVGNYIKRSTIYDDLRRLTEAGYVELISLHGRAKVFALTSKGRKRLEGETKLLQMLAVTSRDRVSRL